jgi:hypothetical protein
MLSEKVWAKKLEERIIDYDAKSPLGVLIEYLNLQLPI